MRAATVCALVAVGVSAASCSQSEGPSAPPRPTDSLTTVTSTPPDDSSRTTSQSTTSTASTSTTTAVGAPPEMPAEAKEPTEAGAEAFVRYYFDLFNFGSSTSTAGVLDQYSSPECVLCSSLAESLTEYENLQLHVEEPGVIVRSVDITVSGQMGTGVVGYRQILPPELDLKGRIITPRGEVSDSELQVQLEYGADGWVIRSL